MRGLLVYTSLKVYSRRRGHGLDAYFEKIKTLIINFILRLSPYVKIRARMRYVL